MPSTITVKGTTVISNASIKSGSIVIEESVTILILLISYPASFSFLNYISIVIIPNNQDLGKILKDRKD
ncbi:putative uncharacterized protein [Streptococcus troglodytae]|uniref:Uncharacterized protein n=1 Tax=Streptococcus troglodytae TaxID=1111760 RepID=A0A1L7LKW3_9STRE|nr:putative uncharacterized protein [Streptococcus troglodytae]